MPPAYNSYGVTTNVSSVMRRVFLKMTLGLLVTAFVAMFALGSDLYWSLLSTKGAPLFLFVAEIGLVIAISGAINRLSPAVASALFYLFAVVNGLALAPIFLVYTGASIAKTFFICSATFGAMSIYGYFTTRDLTRMGSFLIYALFGLIICSVVNIFAHSSMMDTLISAGGVLIFIGLTAWDTNKIKEWAATDAIDGSRLATIGALSLYLDFINLFLYLLRFLGNRK